MLRLINWRLAVTVGIPLCLISWIVLTRIHSPTIPAVPPLAQTTFSVPAVANDLFWTVLPPSAVEQFYSDQSRSTGWYVQKATTPQSLIFSSVERPNYGIFGWDTMGCFTAAKLHVSIVPFFALGTLVQSEVTAPMRSSCPILVPR
jgi:hypothetical protein